MTVLIPEKLTVQNMSVLFFATVSQTSTQCPLKTILPFMTSSSLFPFYECFGSGSGGFIINWPPGSGPVTSNYGSGAGSGLPYYYIEDLKKFSEKSSTFYKFNDLHIGTVSNNMFFSEDAKLVGSGSCQICNKLASRIRIRKKYLRDPED